VWILWTCVLWYFVYIFNSSILFVFCDTRRWIKSKNTIRTILSKKLKRYKPPGTNQILADLIRVEGNALSSKINKLVNFIWNKEELPKQWKESLIVPIYKKGDETDCCNYRRISMLPTTYKILINILSLLNPYGDRDHEYGFQCNKSATDQTFCIHQILEKKWEHNGTVHQLFIYHLFIYLYYLYTFFTFLFKSCML
jgi:hypothetical protein